MSVLWRLRKNISGSEKSQCKGPEVDKRVVCMFREQQEHKCGWSWVSKGKSVGSVHFYIPGECPWANYSASLCFCALAAGSELHKLDFGCPQMWIQVVFHSMLFILIIILRTVIKAFSGSSWWSQLWAKLWISQPFVFVFAVGLCQNGGPGSWGMLGAGRFSQ